MKMLLSFFIGYSESNHGGKPQGGVAYIRREWSIVSTTGNSSRVICIVG